MTIETLLARADSAGFYLNYLSHYRYGSGDWQCCLQSLSEIHGLRIIESKGRGPTAVDAISAALENIPAATAKSVVYTAPALLDLFPELKPQTIPRKI